MNGHAANGSASEGAKAPLRIFIFDNMRTRSNVFYQLFSQHPQLRQVYHPYRITASFGPRRFHELLRHSDARHVEVVESLDMLKCDDTYDDCNQIIAAKVNKAESEGRTIFINEHCSMLMKYEILLSSLRGEDYQVTDNPTFLEDWLLHSVRPVILVRHPAFQVLSAYKAISSASKSISLDDEEFRLFTSNKHSRLLFEFFRERGEDPIVVDGDDCIWRTREMTGNFCRKLGIDPEGVSETWSFDPEEMNKIPHAIEKAFMAELYSSNGIKRPKGERGVPSIDKEAEKWAAQYGDNIAEGLKQLANDALEDYEYLIQFKV